MDEGGEGGSCTSHGAGPAARSLLALAEARLSDG